ncbi:MAG: hypothetical protein ABI867_25735 [Kofleriaceae bacterium]
MRIAALLVLVAFVRQAHAEIDNDQADKLFKQAVELRDKDPAKACALFEQALGFNPQAIGTRLNVALCDERLGRIASAVEKFSEVADRARDQKLDEYLRVAEERLAVLTPDVPFLTITLVAPAPETTVVIDDRVIAADKLAKLAVDPGDRVVVVSAPGRVAYRTTVRVLKRSTATLEIPALAPSVIVKSSRRTVAVIAMATGGGLVLTGVVLGLVARGRYNSTLANDCDANKVCSAEGASDIESARTLGNVGTAITIVGLGTAVAGGVLWYLSPRPHTNLERGVSVLPQLAPGTAGIVAVGRF